MPMDPSPDATVLPSSCPDSLPVSLVSRLLFLLGAAFCLTPWASPGLALILGVLLALSCEHPCPKAGRKASRWLLQISVVMLGFGMNLILVLHAGLTGLAMAAGTITITFVLGALLARWLRIQPTTSLLISAGTAICGGSAIAAVGSVLGVAEAQMTVALGTVFLLNAVALYLFPVLGHLMHLSQTQFGAWSGVAIHDISSVVGAASTYGTKALQIATAVKLSRALWIVPVALVVAHFHRPAAGSPASSTQAPPAPARRFPVPWFIGCFILASLARTFIPGVASASPALTIAARIGLTLTLFLIGAGLSRQTLKAVGVRPMVQGIILWAFISVTSILAIHFL